MNWMEVDSDWDGLSPMLATWWPKLDKDDLQQINGNRETLAQVLCEHYGFSADEAENQICAFEKEVRRPGAVK
jgi:hypothetical protein